MHEVQTQSVTLDKKICDNSLCDSATWLDNILTISVFILTQRNPIYRDDLHVLRLAVSSTAYYVVWYQMQDHSNEPQNIIVEVTVAKESNHWMRRHAGWRSLSRPQQQRRDCFLREWKQTMTTLRGDAEGFSSIALFKYHLIPGVSTFTDPETIYPSCTKNYWYFCIMTVILW